MKTVNVGGVGECHLATDAKAGVARLTPDLRCVCVALEAPGLARPVVYLIEPGRLDELIEALEACRRAADEAAPPAEWN